jgi:hypothetical protein
MRGISVIHLLALLAAHVFAIETVYDAGKFGNVERALPSAMLQQGNEQALTNSISCHSSKAC